MMVFLLSNMQILGGKHSSFLRDHEFMHTFSYLATGQRPFLSFLVTGGTFSPPTPDHQQLVTQVVADLKQTSVPIKGGCLGR